MVFPRMALNSAVGDADALRRTLSLGLRVMWLGVAPSIAIGVALSHPMIAALIQRGAFLPSDTAAVSGLWRIYLISMAAGCLGSVTGRAFYALKQTRTIAAVGVVEALGYAVYTPWLAARFGAAGVAAGYVGYLSLSIGWQLPLLRWRLGRRGGNPARSVPSCATALLRCWAASSRVRPLRSSTRPGPNSSPEWCTGLVTYLGTILLWGGPKHGGLRVSSSALFGSRWIRDASPRIS